MILYPSTVMLFTEYFEKYSLNKNAVNICIKNIKS